MSRFRQLFAMMMVLMVVAPAIAGTAAAASSVSGTVTDSDGNAIEGATVEVLDSSGSVVDSTTTGSDGSYSITSLSDSTEYDVQVSADGYDTASQTVTTGSGTSESVDISLSASTYTVSGTVTDSSGNAIDGATVEILDGNDNVVDSVTAGSDGSYSISGVEAADYTVRAEASGYASVQQDVTVDSATTSDISLLVTDTWTVERGNETPDHVYLEFNESGTAYVAVDAFNNSSSEWETVVDYQTVDVAVENDTVTEQIGLDNYTSENYTEYRVSVDGVQPTEAGVSVDSGGGGGLVGDDGSIPLPVIGAGVLLALAAIATAMSGGRRY